MEEGPGGVGRYKCYVNKADKRDVRRDRKLSSQSRDNIEIMS